MITITRKAVFFNREVMLNKTEKVVEIELRELQSSWETCTTHVKRFPRHSMLFKSLPYTKYHFRYEQVY